MLEAYQVDVSYSDDPDIIDKVHNSLEYQKLDKSLFTGKRFMPKSLGIGAPISQVCGIFYLNMVDSYCKTVLGLRYYDVYMDDRIILHHDKRFLHELLQDIERISVCLGLHVNRDKTQIIPISHGFTFLKTRYLVTDTGRIIKKIPKSVVTRERRKLKKLARFVENGSMTLDQFHEQYRSWRGDKRMYNAHKTIATLDILHRRLTKWIMRNRNSSARSSRKSST